MRMPTFNSILRKVVQGPEKSADAPPSSSTVLPPSCQHPASLSDVPRLFIIGAGARGVAYARAVAQPPPGVESVRAAVVGVAEPNDGKRRRFVERYIQISEGDSLEFNDWRQMVTEDGKRRVAEAKVDGMFICRYLPNPALWRSLSRCSAGFVIQVL